MENKHDKHAADHEKLAPEPDDAFTFAPNDVVVTDDALGLGDAGADVGGKLASVPTKTRT